MFLKGAGFSGKCPAHQREVWRSSRPPTPFIGGHPQCLARQIDPNLSALVRRLVAASQAPTCQRGRPITVASTRLASPRRRRRPRRVGTDAIGSVQRRRSASAATTVPSPQSPAREGPDECRRMRGFCGVRLGWRSSKRCCLL